MCDKMITVIIIIIIIIITGVMFVWGEEEVTVDVSYSKFCIRGLNIRMLLYESF